MKIYPYTFLSFLMTKATINQSCQATAPETVREKYRISLHTPNTPITCGIPESFVRGGQNLMWFFLLDRGSKYRFKWAIIGQPAKRHLNAGLVAL